MRVIPYPITPLKDDMVHIYNGILLSHKNNTWVSSTEVDEPRACYRVSQKEKNKCSNINETLWNNININNIMNILFIYYNE